MNSYLVEKGKKLVARMQRREGESAEGRERFSIEHGQTKVKRINDSMQPYAASTIMGCDTTSFTRTNHGYLQKNLSVAVGPAGRLS